MNRFFITILVSGILLLAACGGGRGRLGQSGDADSVSRGMEELNARIASEPKNADLLHERSRLFMSKNDFNKALQDIHQAISIDGKNSSYLVTLSDIYLFTGQPDNSKETLVRAVEVNAKDTEARLKLAKLYLIMQDYPNCFTAVKELLEIDPSNASAYYTRAIALLEKGDTIPAVNDLKKAVESNQEYYEAYVQLGELYAMKRDRLAELYLKNALKIRPGSREALYMLGMFYQETQNLEQALVVYQNLSEIDTSFREAPYNMGYIHLVYKKDFGRAIDLFSESIRRDPGYFKAYYNRGYAYELSGQFGKAREDYEKTLKLEVNFDKAVEALNRLDQLKVR